MKIEITKRTITTEEMKDIVEYDIVVMDTDPCSLEDLQKLRNYIDRYVDREEKNAQ